MKKSTMKNRPIPRRWRVFLVDQDGAIGIMIALLFPVLLGFAGLAIDVGHMYVVNTQLKNAADAGAKSGARALVPYTGVPLDLNWIAGRDKATATVLLNSADNKQLTDSTVTYGYWNFPTSPPLKSTGIIPTANDFPAVSVTVSKTAGQNNGPVQMFLASVLGVLPADLSQTSVAMIAAPKVVGPHFAKPLAINLDVIDKYWNQPDGYKFKLGEPNNHQTEVDEAIWTTFIDPHNDAKTVKELIKTGGNPTSLAIDENVYIYLQPGQEATLYSDKADGIGSFKNQTIVLPVVDTLEPKTMERIITFIAFHITDSSQGGKWVEGYFDKDYIAGAPIEVRPPTPGIPSVFTPPQMVN